MIAKIRLIFLINTWIVFGVCGQSTPSNTLTLQEYLLLVRQNHPGAKQADNLLKTSEAEILAAKGAFDPKLYGDYGNKTFEGKNYFSLGNFGAKIPTRLGTELKTEFTFAKGLFLNSADKLPLSGQMIVGVSQPILQGFRVDERRTRLRRAVQTQRMYAAQQQILLNDLFYEATKTYWKWAFAVEEYQIFKAAMTNAQKRFKGIKITYELGERMAMDTLESYLQVQERELLVNESNFKMLEAMAKLSNFIWDSEGESPILLQNRQSEIASIIVENVDFLNGDDQIAVENDMINQHPALLNYNAKIKQLEIELRLKQEKLKPKLNLNYNFLGNGVRFPVFLTDNYKWGATFSSPIIFRTERAELQLAALKITDTKLDLEQKKRELLNKLRIALSERAYNQANLRILNQNVANYQQLTLLENIRFELGESTFFLINSREMKYLEAQVKLVKMKIECKISEAAVVWSRGTNNY
jgi:outer membrane protein TolC